MITVLVVDDHELGRVGVSSLLEADAEMRVIGIAASGQEAIALAAQHTPDVALVDLVMPDMDGIETTRRLLAAHPSCRVLALTSLADSQRVRDAIDAGAVGYLLKDTPPTALIDAVRVAARGDWPIDPRAARALLADGRARSAGPSLSDRETEVLRLLTEGLANRQIGRKLGISERTVKAHLTRVFEKLGVQDRTQAALWAQRHGFGQPVGARP